MNERDWQRLIDQLGRGDCTPFLGAGACRTLPTGADLSKRWAEKYGYPFTDEEDLARVMQYAAIWEGDAIYLKERVCEEIRAAPAPDFADPVEPHALLAGLPIPVFLTTNYDNFLAQALTLAGKRPNSAICSWYAGSEYDRAPVEEMDRANPGELNPLVYHLHGSIEVPRSMVITEGDYLEFLVRMASTRDDDAVRIIPTRILTALSQKPLLFIGYSLQDWTFRVLFHGILRNMAQVNKRRNISVQLLPPVRLSREEAEERARQYMTKYFDDLKISIFWGTASQFCAELRQRMSGVS